MTTAFVTGVTGQDGSFLAERLVAEGAEVHGLVRSPNEVEALHVNMPELRVHVSDLADREAITGLVAEIAPDEIYNLGGLSSVAQSWVEPVTTGAISGLAAVGVLEAAWRLTESTGRQIRVLQASSAEIFGHPEDSPQDESTPLAPVNPYGAAKAYAHSMVGIYRSRGLHAVAAVLYNHESPRRPPSFVTRKITQGAARIARGEQNELRLGNVDARRDWGWAPDYVDAMVRAIRHVEATDYVIATGRSRTVREFVATAFQHAGIDDWERYVVIDPAFFRPVDSFDLTGNPERAQRLLSWAPTVSFEEMVGAMVEADLG